MAQLPTSRSNLLSCNKPGDLERDRRDAKIWLRREITRLALP
jgi:hypothetical protein